MCDFCKDICTDEKALLTHEMEIGNGNICEYGVYVYRQDGKVYLSLCDANNGETAPDHCWYCIEFTECTMSDRRNCERWRSEK